MKQLIFLCLMVLLVIFDVLIWWIVCCLKLFREHLSPSIQTLQTKSISICENRQLSFHQIHRNSFEVWLKLSFAWHFFAPSQAKVFAVFFCLAHKFQKHTIETCYLKSFFVVSFVKYFVQEIHGIDYKMMDHQMG